MADKMIWPTAGKNNPTGTRDAMIPQRADTARTPDPAPRTAVGAARQPRREYIDDIDMEGDAMVEARDL